jgi:hypothetical protein
MEEGDQLERWGEAWQTLTAGLEGAEAANIRAKGKWAELERMWYIWKLRSQ